MLSRIEARWRRGTDLALFAAATLATAAACTSHAATGNAAPRSSAAVETTSGTVAAEASPASDPTNTLFNIAATIVADYNRPPTGSPGTHYTGAPEHTDEVIQSLPFGKSALLRVKCGAAASNGTPDPSTVDEVAVSILETPSLSTPAQLSYLIYAGKDGTWYAMQERAGEANHTVYSSKKDSLVFGSIVTAAQTIVDGDGPNLFNAINGIVPL